MTESPGPGNHNPNARSEQDQSPDIVKEAGGTLAARHHRAVLALRAVQRLDEDGGFTLAGARQIAGRTLAGIGGRDAAGTIPVRKFSWDHRAQPPMTEIAAAVTELSGGTVRMTPDSGGDWYGYELRLEAPPGPAVLTFVTWVPETDSVAVKHDGEVVWEENSFGSLGEYFNHCELLGQAVILRVETPDGEDEDAAAAAEPAGGYCPPEGQAAAAEGVPAAPLENRPDRPETAE